LKQPKNLKWSNAFYFYNSNIGVYLFIALSCLNVSNQ
jgi:hypothetical protein